MSQKFHWTLLSFQPVDCRPLRPISTYSAPFAPVLPPALPPNSSKGNPGLSAIGPRELFLFITGQLPQRQYSKALDNVGEFFFSSPIDDFNIWQDYGRSDDDQPSTRLRRFYSFPDWSGEHVLETRHSRLSEQHGAVLLRAALQHHRWNHYDPGHGRAADR